MAAVCKIVHERERLEYTRREEHSFNIQHMNGKRQREEYDRYDRYDREGYDRERYDRERYDRERYDRERYDRQYSQTYESHRPEYRHPNAIRCHFRY